MIEQQQANSLYYLFSTIPQTLGGAIALLGAFVLYRFQSLKARMEKQLSQLNAFEEAEKNHAVSGFPGSLEDKATSQAHSSIQRNIEDQKKSLKKLRRFKKRLNLFFWISLILTIILIFYSVLILWKVSEAVCYFNAISLIGLVLFFLCLISYVFLLVQTIDDKV